MTDSTPTPEFTMRVIDGVPLWLRGDGRGKLRAVYAAAEALPAGKVLEIRLATKPQANNAGSMLRKKGFQAFTHGTMVYAFQKAAP